VLVVSWLLEREYRQHRMLDDELPTTYREWLSSMDHLLQRKAGQAHKRTVKVVIHPGEIETWARHEGREVNEQTRSDYTHLLRRRENERRRARLKVRTQLLAS
jgi:hypothetical protein